MTDKSKFTDRIIAPLANGSAMALDSLGISTTYFCELQRVINGPADPLFLSARLLLGMSEEEALKVRRQSGASR